MKNRQSGKKLPKWLKVFKLGSKGFQGVPDGSRCQIAWVRTTRGTYAWAPYAFAALGQGPKGPELVTHIFDDILLVWNTDVKLIVNQNII